MCGIRNDLCHMQTQNFFDVDDTLMAQFLNDIDKLVECLITLKHFTPLQGDGIRDELNKVQCIIIKEVALNFKLDLYSVYQCLITRKEYGFDQEANVQKLAFQAHTR